MMQARDAPAAVVEQPLSSIAETEARATAAVSTDFFIVIPFCFGV
jgi:hypothetical protein